MMTGADLIHLAGHLAVNRSLGANDEARFRSAVSRAYYGAFHLVSSFLEKVRGQPVMRNQHGHRQAYEQLLGLGKTEMVAVARLLDNLRHDRNKADYDLNTTAFRDQLKAQQCVERADEIRMILDRYSP
ncbi:MAG: HEPN domain-containing protein [Planctomycetaceae bacterium]|nr:HEPN domain-containing protein [Planctomycetaceae bacterium]